MRIGIFGGSFDPVHRGHLALASYACSELNLDKVYFVPSYINPLKRAKRLLSAATRLSLVKKSIGTHPKFAVSDVELKKKKVSYTIDTLRAFRKKFGRTAQIYFLAGADNAKDFSRWKSGGEVLKLCRFVLFTRPESAFTARDKRFLWMPMPPVAVSSSEIRSRLEGKKNVSRLVPAEITGDMQRRAKSRPRKK